MWLLLSSLVHLLFYTYTIDAVGQGVVRLYRNGVADTSQSWSSGIVQIYYSGQWGNICDDSSFGSDEADVICHQLGYTGASSYSNTGTTSAWGSDSASTVMDDVSCSFSSYLTITQCSFNTNITSSCASSDDVTVTCSSTRIWATPFPGYIRLTGGTYSNQGLLEVYCNGQWGTVCDDYFTATQARVACRQLGYNYYENYDHLSYSGNSMQNIWLNTYSSCSSTDSCLTSCDKCPSTPVVSCSHTEDITLECNYSTSYSKVTSTTSTNCDPNLAIGTVRLYRNGVADTSQSWSSGIVQIYYSGQWGNICDDSSFGSDEADVICHQLGYTGASSYSNTGTTSTWGSDSSPTVMDDVSCSTSSYLTITQCSFSTSISFSFTDNNDVVVTCNSTRIWDSPSTGDIRLTGGNYSNQGLLEVYCNGQWGTVCDDSFGFTEARIACAQLGYNDYDDYDHLSQRGNSSQNIWLDTTATCSSLTDICLTSCGSCSANAITSCTHSDDITLSCEYSSTFSKASQFKNNDYCGIYSTGTIRLYRDGVPDTSQSWSSGIVQIYYSGQWGNICYGRNFRSAEADVICHQLGYTGASSYSNTGITIEWGSDSSSTVMDDVSCSTSSYLTITQCSFSTSISCSFSTDVIVMCYSTRIWDSPSTGDIRLTGGTYSNQGLLEVYCNGQWGTVCGDYFGDIEARIACRQLGYNYQYSYDRLPKDPTSSRITWLQTLSACSSSNDHCLTNCGGCPVNQRITDCSSYVTLTCEFNTRYFLVATTVSTNCTITEGEAGSDRSAKEDATVIDSVVGGVVGFVIACCVIIAVIFVCVCCRKTEVTHRVGGAIDRRGGADNRMGGATDRRGGADNRMGGATNRKGGARADYRMGGATDSKGETDNRMGGATDRQGHGWQSGATDKMGGVKDNRLPSYQLTNTEPLKNSLSVDETSTIQRQWPQPTLARLCPVGSEEMDNITLVSNNSYNVSSPMPRIDTKDNDTEENDYLSDSCRDIFLSRLASTTQDNIPVGRNNDRCKLPMLTANSSAFNQQEMHQHRLATLPPSQRDSDSISIQTNDSYNIAQSAVTALSQGR